MNVKIFNKKLALLLLLAGILSSCSSLSKSQLAEVNTFGNLTKNFSDCPNRLFTAYQNIHVKALVYDANATMNPDEHFKSLYRTYELKSKLIKINERIDLSLRIIDKYGQSLVLLTSDKYRGRLDTASQKTGENLDGLIKQYNAINTGSPLPSGIGAAVSGLISIGGTQYIRKQQAKEIKIFVKQADPMINQLTDVLASYLNGTFTSPSGSTTNLKDMIAAEKSEIQNDYKAYLGYSADQLNIDQSPDTIRVLAGRSKSGKEIYKDKIVYKKFKGTIQKSRFAGIEQDHDFIVMLLDLEQLILLCEETLASIAHLKKAHNQLLIDVQEKKNLKELAVDIQGYGNDVHKMYTILKSIKH